jgi:hypothetical protein
MLREFVVEGRDPAIQLTPLHAHVVDHHPDPGAEGRRIGSDQFVETLKTPERKSLTEAAG